MRARTASSIRNLVGSAIFRGFNSWATKNAHAGMAKLPSILQPMNSFIKAWLKIAIPIDKSVNTCSKTPVRSLFLDCCYYTIFLFCRQSEQEKNPHTDKQ